MAPKVAPKRKRQSTESVVDVEDLALPQASRAAFRSQLLDWYDQNRRKLPWRGDSAPYGKGSSPVSSGKATAGTPKISQFFQRKSTAPGGGGQAKDEPGTELPAPPPGGVSAYGVWVSEVMLQQTRVETVIEYWLRWMERFPTLEALAGATAEEVNSLWAGLGYYSRARRLHEGAQRVVNTMGGEMPRSAEALKGLPGVGDYTAGAVASIAFGEAAPAVDGNVVRVFSRLHRMEGEPAALLKPCWALAGDMLDQERPGTYNQALMELGATVCTPKSPSCSACPVQNLCRVKAAVDAGECEAVTLFPAKAVKKPPKDFELAVAVVSIGSGASQRFLLRQRPASGLLANQWEFPSVDVAVVEEDSPVTALETLVVNLMEAAAAAAAAPKGTLPAGKEKGQVIHLFSHQRHTMNVHSYSMPDQKPGPQSPVGQDGKVRWMTREDMKEVGVTTGMKKVLSCSCSGKGRP